MSLIEKLEAYVKSQIHLNQDEAVFLKNLEKFLKENKNPRAEYQLLDQINTWKNSEQSDDRVYALVSDFIHKRQVDPEFNADKFLNSKPRPDINMFKSLTPAQLNACLKYDKKQFTYHSQIVHVMNKENADTDLIIWLLEHGFEGSSWDTGYICENENLRLLKYYVENKICGDLNCHALGKVVNKNNMAIFNYILDNNLLPEDYMSRHGTFYGAIYNCIGNSNLEMLQILYNKDKKIFKEIIEKEFYGFPTRMRTAPSTICLWLWDNGIKWTAQIAKQTNNKFMISFF